MTSLPVIGVPIMTKSLKGMDSLLSIVQMPFGIPVATVAINGSKNAAILAIRILALEDGKLAKKLNSFMEAQRKSVLEERL
jgi:5-(carboxyamino)imidazole ribonucleotide mutase